MNEPRTAGPFYVAGGTLRPGTPSYVARRADAELYDHLLAGDFCYVLTARQMGKSSLMASTAKRLESEGVRAAIVDLTQIGTERGAADATQWYFGVAHEIHRRLGIAEPLRPWWQERADLPALQRLTGFFRELVLPHCPGKVVIFVDEIDSTIGLPFADDFFAAIRACFNARATDSAFERLTFVLLGVASPDQLIQDAARTPFNIGQRIDLGDFTQDEAHPLAAGLHPDPGVAAQRLERVFHWTGGHPYLTQSLCRAVEEKRAETASAEAIVDPVVETLFLSSRAQREETNLKHARARLTQEGAEGRRLLRLYLRVRRGQEVPDEPTSPLFAQLKLSGVVKVQDDGNLAVRNRIYEAVFTPQWARSEMPGDRGYQLAAAILAAVVIGLLLYYEVFYPRIYVRQLQAATESDAYEVAAQAADKLKTIPFWRPRASELMAQFWEHRALYHASLRDRDKSLLSWLKAIEAKDTPRRRKEAQALVGDDYGELEATFRSSNPVAALAFSSDSRYILGANLDGEVRTWSREAGRSLRRVERIPRAGAGFSVVQLSRDGRMLLTLDPLGHLNKYDLETDHLVGSVATGLPPRTDYSAISRDGRYAVIEDEDAPPHRWVWDIQEQRRHLSALSQGESSALRGFSTDGTVVAGVEGERVRMWSSGTEQLAGHFLQQDTYVSSVEFGLHGRLVATGDLLGQTRLWERETGEPTGLLLNHGRTVTTLSLSPDNRRLLTGGDDNVVRMWRTREGPPEKLALHKGIPQAIGFHGSGILVVEADGTLGVSGIGSEPVRPLWKLATDSRVLFGPDSQTVLEITGAVGRLRTAASGALVCPPMGGIGPIRFVAFSRDGQMVAFSGRSAAQLWDTGTCKLLTFLDPPPFFTASFSPDDQRLVVTDTNGAVRILDTRSGRPGSAALNFPDPVHLVEFSPDGRTILIRALGSPGSRIEIWDLALNRSTAPPLKLDFIQDMAFRPDGRAFFVASYRWLYSFSLDEGNVPRLQSARLLRGTWKRAFRFVPGCADCLQVVLGYSDSFFVETIHFDEPDNPPLQGAPKELLAKWQKVLGLQFDKKMNFFFQY